MRDYCNQGFHVEAPRRIVMVLGHRSAYVQLVKCMARPSSWLRWYIA